MVLAPETITLTVMPVIITLNSVYWDAVSNLECIIYGPLSNLWGRCYYPHFKDEQTKGNFPRTPSYERPTRIQIETFLKCTHAAHITDCSLPHPQDNASLLPFLCWFIAFIKILLVFFSWYCDNQCFGSEQFICPTPGPQICVSIFSTHLTFSGSLNKTFLCSITLNEYRHALIYYCIGGGIAGVTCKHEDYWLMYVPDSFSFM